MKRNSRGARAHARTSTNARTSFALRIFRGLFSAVERSALRRMPTTGVAASTAKKHYTAVTTDVKLPPEDFHTSFVDKCRQINETQMGVAAARPPVPGGVARKF